MFQQVPKSFTLDVHAANLLDLLLIAEVARTRADAVIRHWLGAAVQRRRLPSFLCRQLW